MLKKDNNENQNFWISYADLMAGLLFVFILVVGAIVVKSELIQSDLQTMRLDLEKEKEALGMSESQLSAKKKKLQKLIKELKSSRSENMQLSMQISMLKTQTNELNDNIALLNANITSKSSKLSLSIEELQSLKELLLQHEEEKVQTNQLLLLSQADKELLEGKMALTADRLIESQNEALSLKYDMQTQKDSFQRSQKKHQDNIDTLGNTITQSQKQHKLDSSVIKIKDDEIVQLEKALLLRSRAYQRVVDDLNITKLKIKNLTGIKITVVKRLKEKLGDSIKIDSKTGALSFSSNILFAQGQSVLKPKAKKELSHILGRYIDALLSDEKMRRYVSSITIEGHTNSDGAYLYNLNLSQLRALAVMEFLYKQYPNNRKLFRKYLNASGRSFSQPVLNMDGIEDKDASRRIEIKFSIKSEDTVRELMNYLNKKR